MTCPVKTGLLRTARALRHRVVVGNIWIAVELDSLPGSLLQPFDSLAALYFFAPFDFPTSGNRKFVYLGRHVDFSYCLPSSSPRY